MAVASRRAIFLDKDGTLLENVPNNVAASRMSLAPTAGDALALWAAHGFSLLVVSNQSGVAHGLFEESALAGVEKHLRKLTSSAGGIIAGFYYCPHHPEGRVAPFRLVCECRKPSPGLLLRAADDHGIAIEQSWMVGDILDDVEAGRRAGCRTVLVNRGHETEWRLSPFRWPDYMAVTLLDAARFIVGQALPAAEPAGEPGVTIHHGKPRHD